MLNKDTWVHISSCMLTKKVCNENETKKKQCARKNVIRKEELLIPIQETGENDLHKLQVNDYGYNEGTINFV